jgi:Fe-S-cluster containining protein
MSRDINFPCVGCGACCKNIAGILENVNNYPEPYKSEIKAFPFKPKSSTDRSCEMLDAEGKCTTYDKRPTLCNITKLFSKHFKKVKTRREYYRDTAKSCNILMEQQGLDTPRIDLKKI